MTRLGYTILHGKSRTGQEGLKSGCQEWAISIKFPILAPPGL